MNIYGICKLVLALFAFIFSISSFIDADRFINKSLDFKVKEGKFKRYIDENIK